MKKNIFLLCALLQMLCMVQKVEAHIIKFNGHYYDLTSQEYRLYQSRAHRPESIFTDGTVTPLVNPTPEQMRTAIEHRYDPTARQMNINLNGLLPVTQQSAAGPAEEPSQSQAAGKRPAVSQKPIMTASQKQKAEVDSRELAARQEAELRAKLEKRKAASQAQSEAGASALSSQAEGKRPAQAVVATVPVQKIKPPVAAKPKSPDAVSKQLQRDEAMARQLHEQEAAELRIAQEKQQQAAIEKARKLRQEEVREVSRLQELRIQEEQASLALAHQLSATEEEAQKRMEEDKNYAAALSLQENGDVAVLEVVASQPQQKLKSPDGAAACAVVTTDSAAIRAIVEDLGKFENKLKADVPMADIEQMLAGVRPFMPVSAPYNAVIKPGTIECQFGRGRVHVMQLDSSYQNGGAACGYHALRNVLCFLQGLQPAVIGHPEYIFQNDVDIKKLFEEDPEKTYVELTGLWRNFVINYIQQQRLNDGGYGSEWIEVQPLTALIDRELNRSPLHFDYLIVDSHEHILNEGYYFGDDVSGLCDTYSAIRRKLSQPGEHIQIFFINSTNASLLYKKAHWYSMVLRKTVDGSRYYYVMDSVYDADRVSTLGDPGDELSIAVRQIIESIEGLPLQDIQPEFLTIDFDRAALRHDWELLKEWIDTRVKEFEPKFAHIAAAIGYEEINKEDIDFSGLESVLKFGYVRNEAVKTNRSEYKKIGFWKSFLRRMETTLRSDFRK